MVSHKERMIEARRARVPIARVSAGYEAADAKAKRVSALLLGGLLVPLVCVCLGVVIVLLQPTVRGGETANDDRALVTRPASSRPMLDTRGPVQMSVDRFDIGARGEPARPAPLPIVDQQPLASEEPARPQQVARAESAEPAALPSDAATPAPVTEACIERVADSAARIMIWFQPKSAEIGKEQQARLRRLASQLTECPTARVEVGGHADDAADTMRNAELSFQRAQAVSRVLAAGGVTPGQLSPVAYGASRPLSSNRKAQDVALNRRVDLVVR